MLSPKNFLNKKGNNGNGRINRKTRSDKKIMFVIPKVNKIVFLKSVSFLSPQLFNSLPLEIKNYNSCITFIGRLKEFSLFKLGHIDPLFIVHIYIKHSLRRY